MIARFKTAAVAAILMWSFSAQPIRAGDSHTACNCWEGDYICTLEDEHHNVIGFIILHDTGC